MIRGARKKAGLTQKEMSEKLEIPLRTIEDWETGRRNPPAWAEKLIVEKLESMGEKGMNEFKNLIKQHSDEMTIPEAIREIHKEYSGLGYKTTEPLVNTFFYWLDDGTKIHVYWKNGSFYEEAL